VSAFLGGGVVEEGNPEGEKGQTVGVTPNGTFLRETCEETRLLRAERAAGRGRAASTSKKVKTYKKIPVRD